MAVSIYGALDGDNAIFHTALKDRLSFCYMSAVEQVKPQNDAGVTAEGTILKEAGYAFSPRMATGAARVTRYQACIETGYFAAACTDAPATYAGAVVDAIQNCVDLSHESLRVKFAGTKEAMRTAIANVVDPDSHSLGDRQTALWGAMGSEKFLKVIKIAILGDNVVQPQCAAVLATYKSRFD